MIQNIQNYPSSRDQDGTISHRSCFSYIVQLQNRTENSKKLTLCNVVVSDHDDIITISETECRNIRHLHINLPATTTKGKLRLRILEYQVGNKDIPDRSLGPLRFSKPLKSLKSIS